jgi:hypothetical protein
MGWIMFEALGFFCPGCADLFVGCKSFEGLESSGEVVGIYEVGEMFSEVLVSLVVEALDGGFFERAIHAFDLAVGPRVFWFGEAVVDVGFGAGELEGMSAEAFSVLESEFDLGGSRTTIAGRGDVDSVVGEHTMDRTGDGGEERVQKVGRNPLRGLLMHLDKGELRGAVDRDHKVEWLPDLLNQIVCLYSVKVEGLIGPVFLYQGQS